MRRLGADLVKRFDAGDTVLLEGQLGVGKTTLVRGMILGLGWKQEVRSPTFNLISEYPTKPPIMHADLYRLRSWHNIGLEDYIDTHLCLIEWPDRAKGLVDKAYRIQISFLEQGREVQLSGPV